MSNATHRPSNVIRAELDEVNRKRRAIDKQIADRRRDLEALNARVKQLEPEYQASVAAEAMAAAAGKPSDATTH